MSGAFSKSMARNVFFGGTVFFFLLFLALTFDTINDPPNGTSRKNTIPQAPAGKHIWETRNCIGCHTLMGEGAYFAPELGNVITRFGSKEAIKAFIQSRPVEGIEGRRSMPQFNLTEEELDAVAAFLEHVSKINNANWPPNVEG